MKINKFLSDTPGELKASVRGELTLFNDYLT